MLQEAPPHMSGMQCRELAAKLAGDLEREGIRGKTLTLKLKPPTFEVSVCDSQQFADDCSRHLEGQSAADIGFLLNTCQSIFSQTQVLMSPCS